VCSKLNWKQKNRRTGRASIRISADLAIQWWFGRESIRNQVQEQREVGYVFAGSQPSLMQEILSAKRPFHKAGPQVFLDKIPAEAWKEFITAQFRKRGRTLDDEVLTTLLATADLIPYDVQRIAHELWDYAELKDKRTLRAEDVKTVINTLVIGQSTYYELLWERLPARQRAALQALAHRGAAEIYSQAVREEFRLGPASSVQKAVGVTLPGITDSFLNQSEPLGVHYENKRSQTHSSTAPRLASPAHECRCIGSGPANRLH
jgi:hypothetical protein